jgi:hypothetical protein
MDNKMTSDEIKKIMKNLLSEEDVDLDGSAIEIIPSKMISLNRTKVKSVKKVESSNDQYVYDIGMKNQSEPWFFGNDILVHNSAYFTAMPMINSSPEMKAMWTKDTAIQIYDELAENTNTSFPEFMERAFHCPRKNGEIIKAGREIVADRGLFVKKKKYAVLVYDKEGKRYDTNGKTGKLKVTGFDMKRSDTPKFVQVFLETVLNDVLGGVPKETIMENIKEFKQTLREMDPWTKGSPKAVKRITDYTAAQEKANNGKGSSKINMPGHTRAALNWNYLRKMNGDTYSQKIVDGMKIVVCKLKSNPLGLTSVAYPTDQLRLPQWFLDLPFDVAEMERVLLDEKIDNMIGILNWDLRKNTDINSTFADLFSFE